MQPFSKRVLTLIRAIPHGRVCSYGLLAAAAGSPRGARQVARLLHSCARNHDLPWHRVVNREGRIVLEQAEDLQRALLLAEGVQFCANGRVDLAACLWLPPG